MANTNRRMPDREDKFFFPKTMDGSSVDPGFITGTKFGIIVGLVMLDFFILISVYNGFDSYFMMCIKTVVLIFISQLIIRYVVLNERYYFKTYLRTKEYKTTTPATFWKIVDRYDTSNGCIATFSDTRVGVYVKLERDSIVGKTSEFREEHYDAISELYKSINKAKLKFVSLNVMETAGKDLRIPELDNIVTMSEFNSNLNKLMAEQVGYIKNLTRITNYNSEYLFIYSDMPDSSNDIIYKVEEILYTLMSGAYSGYYILNSTEIDELVKEIYDVKIFDSALATLSIYDQTNGDSRPAFKLSKIGYTDGRVEKYYTEEEIEIRERLAEKNKQKENINKAKGNITKAIGKHSKHNNSDNSDKESLLDSKNGEKLNMEDNGSPESDVNSKLVESGGTKEEKVESFEDSFGEISELDTIEDDWADNLYLDEDEEIEL